MFTVNNIAEIMKGEVLGDGSVQIKDIKHPEFAAEGDMTFAMDKKSLDIALASGASCVMTTFKEAAGRKTLLYVADIKSAVTMLYNILLDIKQTSKGTVHSTAVIDGSAILGKAVTVGANAVIGENVRVGDNTSIGAGCVISANAVIGAKCFIFPNVTIYEHTVIKDKVVIHSGTVIGADGFGYVPKNGKIYKVPQMGRVIIEEGVEIGANSCVDRGTFDTTVIGRNSKLDNMVQIAHNVKIGERVMMAAQVGIGGTSSVGDDTMMGGQVGVSDHVQVGKNVKIGAQSGVLVRKVKDNAVLFGYPARDAKEYMKKDAFAYRLLKHADKLWKFLKQ